MLIAPWGGLWYYSIWNTQMIDDKGDEIICRAEKNKLLPLMIKMGEAMNTRIQNNFSNPSGYCGWQIFADGRWVGNGFYS